MFTNSETVTQNSFTVAGWEGGGGRDEGDGWA